MSLEFARQKLKEIVTDSTTGLATQGGRLLLNSLFPNDFEYYIMAFEVVNGDGIPTDRMVLPVLPQNISINKQKIKNIQKTGAGITVFQNNTFEPIPITIQGTFGRRLRLMLGSFESTEEQTTNPNQFFLNVKTGYGALKQLERIYEKDGQLDGNNVPFRINFYNLAFNQSFVVEMNNLQVRQDEGNNMIWYYTLNMTAVGLAEAGGFEFEQSKFAALGVGNKVINELATDARSIISSFL